MSNPAQGQAHNSLANRLAGETSPYLQQHAENPVDWHPWGAEALEKARHNGREQHAPVSRVGHDTQRPAALCDCARRGSAYCIGLINDAATVWIEKAADWSQVDASCRALEQPHAERRLEFCD